MNTAPRRATLHISGSLTSSSTITGRPGLGTAAGRTLAPLQAGPWHRCRPGPGAVAGRAPAPLQVLGHAGATSPFRRQQRQADETGRGRQGRAAGSCVTVPQYQSKPGPPPPTLAPARGCGEGGAARAVRARAGRGCWCAANSMRYQAPPPPPAPRGRRHACTTRRNTRRAPHAPSVGAACAVRRGVAGQGGGGRATLGALPRPQPAPRTQGFTKSSLLILSNK